jgi:hypothetical protein
VIARVGLNLVMPGFNLSVRLLVLFLT